MIDHEHKDRDSFVFRGERDYLHSTSLFDYLLAEHAGRAGAARNIDFTFLRRTRAHCRVAEKREGEARLVASYTDDSGSYFVYETSRPIERSVPYREPAAGEDYDISGDCASVRATAGNSFIELAVGAYKGLLAARFPEYSGKFIFSRLVLERIPKATFAVCYKRKVARHFFEGVISTQGNPLGLIYFGV